MTFSPTAAAPFPLSVQQTLMGTPQMLQAGGTGLQGRCETEIRNHRCKKRGGARQISAFAAALCVGSNVFRVPLSSKFYYHVILTAASPLSANPKPKQNTILRTVTLKGSHFSFLSPAGPLPRIQMLQN